MIRNPGWKFLSVFVLFAHSVTFSIPPVFAEDIQVQDGSVNDWQNFNVNEGEHTSVTVVDAQGNPVVDGRAVINVLQDFASKIDGQLDINGIIAFFNSHGFDIGPNADVNVVGGLILSTMKISESDFFAGMAALNQGLNDPGFISNRGHIDVDPGSFLALIAGAIKNSGTIAANGGTAILAAGSEGELTIGGDGLVSVKITEPVKAEVYDFNGNKVADQISNDGSITANGGLVKLTAQGAEQLFDNIINHSGVIEANTLSEQNGQIILDGGNEGVVNVSGDLNAKGDDAGETGGTIHVLGHHVGIFDGVTVDASGDSGGGTVLIGGDYKGSNQDIRNAEATYVGLGVTIDASAANSGNGGKIIVWGNESTQAHGTLLAKGGAVSGNGGFIETSAHYLNVDNIYVSTAAANGENGDWLLDPYDITISNEADNNNSNASPFTPTGSSSVLNINTLLTALDNSDVTVETGGDAGSGSGSITLSDSLTSASTNALTLNAFGGVTLNGSVNLGGDFNITSTTFSAGQAINTAGIFTLTNSGTATLNANITADNGISFSGAVSLGSNVTMDSSAGNGNISLSTVNGSQSFTLNAGAGGISVGAIGSIVSLTGVSLTGGDGVTLNGNISSTGDVSITGPVTLGNDVTISTNNIANDGDVAFANAINGSHSLVVDAGTGGITLGGAIGGNTALSTLTLTGGSAIDLTATHTTGAVNVTATNVTQNSAITTAGGSVTINASGDFSQSADGSITAGSGSTWGNITIHAGTGTVSTGAVTLAGLLEGKVLTVDTGSNSTGDITQSGTLTSHDTNTSTHSISILNDGTGNIVQTNTGTMTLIYADARSIGVSLTASNGSITQSGSIDAKQSAMRFDAQEGDSITQDDGGGQLGSVTAGLTIVLGQSGATANLSGSNSFGLVTGSSAGNLTLNDINASGLNLDTLTVDGNLNITANSISEGGEPEDFGIQMTGTGKTAAFTVAEGGAVDLDHRGGNDFGGNSVSIVGASNTAAGAVTLVDENTSSLLLGTISSSSLNVTSGANISQSGAATIIVSGTTALDAGTNTISLGNANEFGDTITVGHTGITAGAVTIESGTGSLTVGQVDTNANTKLSSLSLNSAGGIFQSGAWVVTGTTTLAANSLINLTEANNDFSTLQIGHAGNNVSVTDKNAVILGASDMANDFNLTAGGNITQSGAVTIDGIATLDAGSDNITLNNIGNDFGTLGFTGDTVVIIDSNGVALGTVSASELNLVTVGAITKANSNVSISVTGDTILDSGGNNITINGTNNDFNTLTVDSSNNLTITDTNDISLGSVVANGAVNITAAGAINGEGTVTAGANSFLTAADEIGTLGTELDVNITGTLTLSSASANLTGTATAVTYSVTLGGTGIGFFNGILLNPPASSSISSENSVFLTAAQLAGSEMGKALTGGSGDGDGEKSNSASGDGQNGGSDSQLIDTSGLGGGDAPPGVPAL